MKQAIKKMVGVSSIVVLSAGVAGITTDKMMQSQVENQSSVASNGFQLNTGNNATLTSFTSSSQPFDFTGAAESSLHAVVSIQSTQQAKSPQMQAPTDIFEFLFGGLGRRRQQQSHPQAGFVSAVKSSQDCSLAPNKPLNN